MDNKTTNKDEAKGSETLNHELMIKHVIALFRDTMPFNQLLGLEFVTEGEGLETQVSLHLDWQPALTGNPMQKILHGGVTATMLDTIGGLVSIETNPPMVSSIVAVTPPCRIFCIGLPVSAGCQSRCRET